MGWRMKMVVIFAVVLFVATTAWLGFVVYARYQSNDYSVQVAAAFNAALLVNGEETFTDPDRAVISGFQGRRYVIVPENYKAIVSLLRKDCAMPPFKRAGKDAPLTITVCDSATISIRPDGDGVDAALIDFTTGDGKRYAMHVRGGNIWKQFVEYATAGHGQNKNLPL